MRHRPMISSRLGDRLPDAVKATQAAFCARLDTHRWIPSRPLPRGPFTSSHVAVGTDLP